MLSTALAWAILWPGASPVVPVALPQPLVVPATCAVAPVGDEAEELVELLRLRGNRISVDDLTRLAKIGSPEALAGFELALDGGVLTSEVARARALRATAYFMKSRDVAGKVREKLANWAANAPNSLEGIAAVETLAAGGGIAKEWLQRIVESPAVTAVRVRAFELHRESFEMKEDRDWYYQLWQKYDAASRAGSSAPEDPSVGKPLGTVAGLAFEAIAPKLEEEMLRRALSDQNSRVRTAAMAELADRGDKSIVSQARATFLNTQYGATERAQCAAVYGSAEKWEDVFAEVERSLLTGDGRGPASPKDVAEGTGFVRAFAELMSERQDDSFATAVSSVFDDSSPGARAMYALAVSRNGAKAAEKVLRNAIDDEDLAVRVEGLRALAQRGTEGARKLLDTQLRKADTESEKGILVELVTELYGGDPSWVAELEKMAAGEPSLTKNAALTCLARVGGAYEQVADAALDPEAPWGTQRAAIEALRDLRTKEATEKLIFALERLDERAADLACEALRRLTGEKFRRTSVWPRWWADHSEGFVPLTAKEYDDLLAKREAAAEEASEQIENKTVVGTFFGVELDSERLAFVIDCSGSMQEPMGPRTGGPGGKSGPTTGGGNEKDPPHVPRGSTRLEVAQNELLHFLGLLPETALVNVVRFSNDAKPWSSRLESIGKEKTAKSIRAFVEKLNPDGGTNVYAALKQAFEDPDVDTIMFLSDGVPSVGEVLDIGTIASHVRIWNANRGVEIHIVSIGVEQPVLKALAEETGGSYTTIR